jgi:hypothetical protein
VAKAEKQRKTEERVAQMTPEEKLAYDKKQERQEARKKLQAAKSGTPMKDYGFWKWTDVTTSRWQSIYENLFGESIQFHQDYFLEDTLVHRPVFVSYNWSLSYWIEALVVLLFLAGIWCGRKSRFLWLCLSCFAFDMFIHLVLGFGLNEIHIMTPHWLFVMPIAIAFLLREVKRRWVRIPIVLLTLYLLSYNGYLLTSFLLSKLWIVL